MPRRAIIAASLAAPRRADPGRATWTRPARSRTASRPSTSSSRSPIPTRCCRRSAMPARSSSGHHASEALGDYCAGPNHVLPTGRTARFSSPLGVYDFQKRTSVLDVSIAAARDARAASRPTLARRRRAARRTREARAYRAETRIDDARRLPTSSRPSSAPGDPRAHGLRGRARRRHDQARRDGEPVSRCRRALRAKLAAAVADVPRQPLSRTAAPTRSRRRCARRSALPDGVGIMLGNGSDELIQMLTIGAGARPARRCWRPSRRS